MGQEAASLVSSIFVKPIKLEFEKVYLPYLLMNKKRYAGMLWTTDIKYDKMDAKGIETVRRDNCELVRNVVQNVLNYILIDQNIDYAQQYLKNIISNLLSNKIDMSSLVISKQLGKIEDYKSNLPHVELAKKMKERDAATAPKVGDRVPYVITKGVKNARAYERAEDPLYALENSIPLDTNYYLENQLQLPLERIFEPILGEKGVKTLFSGDHTRSKTVSTSKVGALMKFAQVQKTCIGCKAQLKTHQTAVCDRCKPNEGQYYLRQIAQVRTCEKQFHRLWTQCQHCQNSLTQEVLCSNRDCPIFYRRTKARKDLEKAQKTLQQFTF